MAYRRRIRGHTYEVPLLENPFEEKPILEMSCEKEGFCIEKLDSTEKTPFCIRLLCQIQPIPLEDHVTTLEAKISRSVSVKPVPLYPTYTRPSWYEKCFDIENREDLLIPILWDESGKVVQAIEIVPAEKALVQMEEREGWELFSQGSLGAWQMQIKGSLFIKPFLYWDHSIIVEERLVAGGSEDEPRTQILPASAPMQMPIFPYGGYYRPGLPLDQMEPLFLQVMERQEQTLLSVTRKENWKKKGIIPPESGKIRDFTIEFLGNFLPIHAISVAETILGGYVEIMLEHLEGEKVSYKSFSYEVAESEKDLYWISFCAVH